MPWPGLHDVVHRTISSYIISWPGLYLFKGEILAAFTVKSPCRMTTNVFSWMLLRKKLLMYAYTVDLRSSMDAVDDQHISKCYGLQFYIQIKSGPYCSHIFYQSRSTSS
jgi:hypothetical protein